MPSTVKWYYEHQPHRIRGGVGELTFVKCWTKLTLDRSPEGKADNVVDNAGNWVNVVLSVCGSSHCFNFLIEVQSEITI